MPSPSAPAWRKMASPSPSRCSLKRRALSPPLSLARRSSSRSRRRAAPLFYALCSQSSSRGTLLRWSATLVFQNVGRPRRAEPGCHSGSLQCCSLPGSLSSQLLRQSRCRDRHWIVPCFGSYEAFNCVNASWRAASANVRNSRSQISLPGRAFTYATLVLTSVRGLLRGSAADRAKTACPPV